jgi:hypothetical protein
MSMINSDIVNSSLMSSASTMTSTFRPSAPDYQVSIKEGYLIMQAFEPRVFCMFPKEILMGFQIKEHTELMVITTKDHDNIYLGVSGMETIKFESLINDLTDFFTN